MNNTPIGNRLHIAIFGKRNAGKSTLINALTNQNLAVVSEVAGTTTDPVYKAMELLPIGPVVIIDTAGIDDVGELGKLRIEKTYEVLRKTNVAIIVIDVETGITEYDTTLIRDAQDRKITVIGVLNKIDLIPLDKSQIEKYKKELNIPIVAISSKNMLGIEELKKLIFINANFNDSELSICGDLINPGDLVVLVTPIDKAAPKGRLILPQQQTIRDILEKDAMAIITKEHELKETFDSLKKKPALVITDSQAFLKVSADTPIDIPLTSFSILFARYKGELLEMVRGIKTLEKLKPESRILVVEGCTHHKQSDDIGTVKIPRWIRQMIGAEATFDYLHGIQFTSEIEKYDAIIHCGGCMLNNQEMKYRIEYAKSHGVAIVNYGMLIAYVQGVLKRALQPFPAATLILEE
jgi:[FeFe] hydrogenase H-cluster maturation GTPase HydF